MTYVTQGHHPPLLILRTMSVTSVVTGGEYAARMISSGTQIRFAPAVASMHDYLEPYLPWLEKVIGCAYSATVTFEIDLPIARHVVSDLLPGVSLDNDP